VVPFSAIKKLLTAKDSKNSRKEREGQLHGLDFLCGFLRLKALGGP
jgi:hypothetical protein